MKRPRVRLPCTETISWQCNSPPLPMLKNPLYAPVLQQPSFPWILLLCCGICMIRRHYSPPPHPFFPHVEKPFVRPCVSTALLTVDNPRHMHEQTCTKVTMYRNHMAVAEANQQSKPYIHPPCNAGVTHQCCRYGPGSSRGSNPDPVVVEHQKYF